MINVRDVMEKDKVIVFLDDDINRAALAYSRWTDERKGRTVWVTTAKETINVLKEYSGHIDEVHLDHDLGGETYVDFRNENCGMEVIRWFEHLSPEESKRYEEIKFTIHSWNIAAARIMVERLCKLGYKRVKHIPFGS